MVISYAVVRAMGEGVQGVGNYFRIFWKSLLEVKTSELKLEE